MPNKNIHVVPRGDGWAVKTAGADRAASVHELKKDAQGAARDLAVKRNGEVIIHDKKGVIINKNSYGNDPNPPKDTRH